MLQDFDKTLENMLIEEGNFNKREIDITFEQPTSEWSARLNRPTLNLWCFDLRENVKLRTMERRVNRENNIGRTSRLVFHNDGTDLHMQRQNDPTKWSCVPERFIPPCPR